jgi:WD40 repeat protein
MKSELQEWQRFIQANSHILNRRASLLFQQALNQSDNSLIMIAGKTRLAAQIAEPVWLRHVNPPKETSSCLRTLAGHAGVVFDCAISHDGKEVLSASNDHTLKLWNPITGEELSTIPGHPEGVIHCTFSPRDDSIVSISSGPEEKVGFRVWDTSTGELIASGGAPNKLLTAAYSLEGNRLAISANDGTLEIWDTESWQCVLAMRGHQGRVEACIFSPDGRRLISGAGDWDKPGEIKIWDGNSGEQLGHIDAHDKGVTTCALSPDGKQMVSGSWDHTIKVWDTGDYHEVAKLAEHSETVRSCAYSPDGRRFVSASWDNTLIIWDAQTFKPVQWLVGHKEWVHSVAWSPDGSYIVSASYDQTLKIWDPEQISSRSRRTQTGIISGLEYSPDGQNLVEVSASQLRLLDATSLEPIITLKGHTQLTSSGKWSAGGERLLSSAWDGECKQWDAQTNQEYLSITCGKEVNNCIYSPDSRFIVTASQDKLLRLWDASSAELCVTFRGHTGYMLKAGSFSPDGKEMVSAGGDDKSLRVWNVETGEARLVLNGHTDWVASCCYSPDGRFILSGSWDQTVRVWDARNGKLLGVMHSESGSILTCAYSADGETIVAGSHGCLFFWNAETFNEVGVFFAGGAVYSAAFRFHGEPIAMGDGSGSISLVKAENYVVGIPILTAIYVYQVKQRVPTTSPQQLYGEWDDEPTARCDWCGSRFVPSQPVINAIARIATTVQLTPEANPCLKLPDEAWRESALLSECAVCRKLVRFNPFLVDNRHPNSMAS